MNDELDDKLWIPSEAKRQTPRLRAEGFYRALACVVCLLVAALCAWMFTTSSEPLTNLSRAWLGGAVANAFYAVRFGMRAVWCFRAVAPRWPA